MALKLLINSYYPSLTKSEQKVADCLQTLSQDEVINCTLTDISKKSGVGDATVLRFCNKIGCEKFSSLKLLLAKELDQENEDTLDNYLDELQFEMTNVIKHTHDLLSIDKVKMAVDYIDQANHVYFFGVGASGLSALEAQGNFLRIGKISTAITDSHFQAMGASIITNNDIIIAFSLTGNTKDIYDSCMIAKENGAKIIAITNYIESEVARIADVVLLTAAKEHILKGGSLAGTISQLFVVDALKQEYSSRHTKKVKSLREKTAQAILPKSL